VPSIRTIFLDAGWTLIRPHPSTGAIYHREASQLGLNGQVPPERFEALLQQAWREYNAKADEEGWPRSTSEDADRQMWRRITRSIYNGIPEMAAVDFDLWFSNLQEAFGRGSAWQCFPDVEPLLGECERRGIRTGIVSNWGPRLAQICGDLGLSDRMDCIVISSVEGVRKPDPVIFEKALSRIGADPRETLHVGDTYHDDVLGARAARITGVWLNREKTPAPADTPSISSLRELLWLIDE
jgi:putative hydrolase of the HAD superfamily